MFCSMHMPLSVIVLLCPLSEPLKYYSLPQSSCTFPCLSVYDGFFIVLVYYLSALFILFTVCYIPRSQSAAPSTPLPTGGKEHVRWLGWSLEQRAAPYHHATQLVPQLPYHHSPAP